MMDHIRVIKIGRWTRLVIIKHVYVDFHGMEYIGYDCYAINKLFIETNVFLGSYGVYPFDKMIAELKAKAYNSYDRLF